MLRWLGRQLGLPDELRDGSLDDRATGLVMLARAVDELAAGLLLVLTPTFQARLGLSLVQVGWLLQALTSVAAVVEPIAATAIDLIRRRPLLVWGALGWAAALLLAAGAPSYGWLLASFALVGTASGPLTHTADVLLVEGHPHAAERITNRTTIIDAGGALLAPAAVALATWAGVDHRALLVTTGAGIGLYGVLLAGTAIPAPGAHADRNADGTATGDPGTRPETDVAAGGQAPRRLARALRRSGGNLRAVLGDAVARRWLLALVLNEVLGVSELFEPVWLRSEVGASQALVGVHVALGMAATLLALVVVERLLQRGSASVLLRGSLLGTLVVYPLWLLLPGIGWRLALVVPRNALMAPLWPILRARSLAAVPGAGGAATALYAMLGLLPLQAVFAWTASRLGLTPTLLGVHVTATVTLLAVVVRADGTPPAGTHG